MVGVVILSKDNTKELFECIKSIHKHTSIDHRIYLADTGSTSDVKRDSIKFIKSLYGDNYKFIEFSSYSFTKNNNDVIKHHLDDDVDMILLCNNDVEIINYGTIDRMCEVYRKNIDRIGTVGCRLLYHDNSIQHDGQKMILPDTRNGSVYFTHNLQNEQHHTQPRNMLTKVVGNTFALALISRKLFIEVGYLNEVYCECFDDIDMCVRLNLRGLVNIIIESDYWAYHYESLSRGKTEEAKKKLQQDYKRIYPFVMSHLKFDINGKRIK